MKRFLVLFAVVLASCGGGDFTDAPAAGPVELPGPVASDAADGPDAVISPVEAGNDHVAVPDAVITPDAPVPLEAGTDAPVVPEASASDTSAPETGVPEASVPEASPDVVVDVAPDAKPDATLDAGVDVKPEATADAPVDGSNDSDSPVADASSDASVDSPACESPCPTSGECDTGVCTSTGCAHDANAKNGQDCTGGGTCFKGTCVPPTPCGANGETCCDSPDGNAAYSCTRPTKCANLTDPNCDYWLGVVQGTALACKQGICQACGHRNEPCCQLADGLPASNCGEYDAFCIQGTCQCGTVGERCCVTHDPVGPGYTTWCDDGSTCVSNKCYKL